MQINVHSTAMEPLVISLKNTFRFILGKVNHRISLYLTQTYWKSKPTQLPFLTVFFCNYTTCFKTNINIHCTFWDLIYINVSIFISVTSISFLVIFSQLFNIESKNTNQ